MGENATQQLSQALNQLLDAYEKLQKENQQIQEENLKLQETIENLESSNNELEEKIDSLSNTTDKQTNEMGEMLTRIESILSSKPEKEIVENEEVTVQVEAEVSEPESGEFNLTAEEIDTAQEKQEDEKSTVSNSTELDLGRMQSLLNGLNS